MADLVTLIVSVTGAALTALGGPAFANAFQNRRDQKLRFSIAENRKLIEEIKEEGEIFSSRKSELEKLVNDQIHALILQENRWLKKRRDWSQLGMVIFFNAIIVPLLWWMWIPDTWWLWVIFTALALFLATMTLGGTIGAFKPKKERN